ncbi:MAG: serine hydrolase domain-containing protein [Pseudomonadota bacterium]
MTRFFVLLFAFGVSCCAADETPDFSALEDRLARYVEEGELPGGVVMVRQGDQTILEHAFGFRDLEAGDPMEPADQFRIASQTKLIVSVGIMMLIEDGELTLDTPLSSFFPEWADVQVATDEGLQPLGRSIVIRDLLSHTSGIGYGFTPDWQPLGLNAWYFADSERSMREAVRAMATMPLGHQPGASWTYGYNTDILGALITEVTGQTLYQFLDDRIFAPLGMDNTAFFLEAEGAGDLTVVYSSTDEGLVRAPDPGGMVGQGHYVIGPKEVQSGGAGLTSTAEDYLRLLDMLRRGGELDGQRLLAPETVALMAEPAIESPAPPWYSSDVFAFGLGHEVSGGRPGGRPAGSLGWGGAYHSVYWIDPVNDLSVVYLTQVIPSGDLDDETVVETMIYQALASGH